MDKALLITKRLSGTYYNMDQYYDKRLIRTKGNKSGTYSASFGVANRNIFIAVTHFAISAPFVLYKLMKSYFHYNFYIFKYYN